MESAQLNEGFYSNKLAQKENGKREAITPVGRIDVLTSEEVIEVKYMDAWKVALGQVLSYGLYHPAKGKRLHLLGCPSEAQRDLVEIVCAKFAVRVTWEDVPNAVKKTGTLADSMLQLNSVEQFIDTSLKPDSAAEAIEKQAVYDDYIGYCIRFGQEPFCFNTFCAKFNRAIGTKYECRKTTRMVDGVRVNVPAKFKGFSVSIGSFSNHLPLFNKDYSATQN